MPRPPIPPRAILRVLRGGPNGPSQGARRAATYLSLAALLASQSPASFGLDPLAEPAVESGNAEGPPIDSPEAAWEQFRKDSKTAWDEASAISQKAWEGARDGSTRLWSQATDEATWRKAQEESEALWRKAQEQSKAAWDQAAERSRRAWEATKDFTQKGWDRAKSTVTGSGTAPH